MNYISHTNIYKINDHNVNLPINTFYILGSILCLHNKHDKVSKRSQLTFEQKLDLSVYWLHFDSCSLNIIVMFSFSGNQIILLLGEEGESPSALSLKVLMAGQIINKPS